jgi:hypothetical protein
MAQKEKAARTDKDRKVQKLTKMIKSKERELELVELKLERAKEQVAKGEVSKGDFQRLHIEIGRDRKAIRSAMTKMERIRLNRERHLKEKLIEKEEKDKERVEHREERARIREEKRQVKDSTTGKEE